MSETHVTYVGKVAKTFPVGKPEVKVVQTQKGVAPCRCQDLSIGVTAGIPAQQQSVNMYACVGGTIAALQDVALSIGPRLCDQQMMTISVTGLTERVDIVQFYPESDIVLEELEDTVAYFESGHPFEAALYKGRFYYGMDYSSVYTNFSEHANNTRWRGSASKTPLGEFLVYLDIAPIPDGPSFRAVKEDDVFKFKTTMSSPLIYTNFRDNMWDHSHPCQGKVKLTEHIMVMGVKAEGERLVKQLEATCVGEATGRVIVTDQDSKELPRMGMVGPTSYYHIPDTVSKLIYRSEGTVVQRDTVPLIHHLERPIRVHNPFSAGFVDRLMSWFGVPLHRAVKAFNVLSRVAMVAADHMATILVVLALSYTSGLALPPTVQIGLVVASFYVRVLGDDQQELDDNLYMPAVGVVHLLGAMISKPNRDNIKWMMVMSLSPLVEVDIILRASALAVVYLLLYGQIDRRFYMTVPFMTDDVIYTVAHHVVMTDTVDSFIRRAIDSVKGEFYELTPPINGFTRKIGEVSLFLATSSVQEHSLGLYTGLVRYISTGIKQYKAARMRKRYEKKNRKKFCNPRRRDVRNMENFILYHDEYKFLKQYIHRLPESAIEALYKECGTILTRDEWDLKKIRRCINRYNCNIPVDPG